MTERARLIDELTLLDAAMLSLWIDDYEDLYVRIGEQDAVRVNASRTFPLTHRDQLIRLVDDEGEEVGLIYDLGTLDRASRAAVDSNLARNYVLPRITRVRSIDYRDMVPTWEVDTDRGPRKIEIRSTRSDIRVMSEHHIIVRDADGNQYEIPDTKQLDAASRTLVNRSL